MKAKFEMRDTTGDLVGFRLPGCPSALSGLDLSRDRSDELKRAEAER